MSSCVTFPSSAFTVNGPSSLGRTPPTEFVTRNGTKLYVGASTAAGNEFRAVGPNIYWLGLDENIGEPGTISYPSQGRVLEILATAAAMGATAVRAHTLGSSTGTPLSVEPSLGVFNENALRVIDFAIYAARAYGLRLIIPLVDQYDYYHGGKLSFLRFRNLSTTDEGAFYTNTDVISDYKQYIGTLVNRTNTYSGLSNNAEPTIMAWETGNELKAPPRAWTAEISAYLKQLAPNQLVIDGAYGVQRDALDIDTVDIYSNHYYPLVKSKLHDDTRLVHRGGKAYYVGEFDWTDKYSKYAYFGCLVPLIFVIIAFCIPARWLRLPWTFHLALWCFPTSRKEQPLSPSLQPDLSGASYGRASAYSPIDDDMDGLGDGVDKSRIAFPPPSPLAEPYRGQQRTRRRITIKKWMFALSFLLLVPFAALIAREVGPISLPRFLGEVERSGAVGSAYWSLFGRDDSCCSWVQHNDGFTLHYRDPKTLSRSFDLTRHAYTWSGQAAQFSLERDSDLSVIACLQSSLSNSTAQEG